jgi:hypothetical protein
MDLIASVYYRRHRGPPRPHPLGRLFVRQALIAIHSIDAQAIEASRHELRDADWAVRDASEPDAAP